VTDVLRWGRTEYERDEDLARERAAATDLGLSWLSTEDPSTLPSVRAKVLVVTSKSIVDATALDRISPQLVITTTSGYDHIDVEACRERGISVGRCPLARRDAVAEFAVGMLIRLLRRLPDQEETAREGRWGRGELPHLAPRSLRGTRVAVIGTGVIGRQVFTLLHAFGAEVRGVDVRNFDPTSQAVPIPMCALEEALDWADAITLHPSRTPSSIGMLSKARLDRLRPGAVVVNTARGDLMDLQATIQAVRQGRIGGLATDVFPQEPWPHLAQYASTNVILTPHSSGYTRGLGARVAEEVASALHAFTRDVPLPHPIDEDQP
jgi:phosphoglycerate dehydrogenase-like enzyme